MSFYLFLILAYFRKGDYHRYLAEFATGNERKEAAEKSLVAYKNATDLATAELPSTHPIRLGLALNFSVFYYEILNSPDRACRLASLTTTRIYLFLLFGTRDPHWFPSLLSRPFIAPNRLSGIWKL